MGWKHTDALQLGPTSTKEHVGNVEEFKSIIKEVDSITKAKKKDTGKKKSCTNIVISDKKQGSGMSEMGRNNVSTKVAITTDIK